MQQLNEQVSLQCQFMQTLQWLHLEAATYMFATCCARSCGTLLTTIKYTVFAAPMYRRQSVLTHWDWKGIRKGSAAFS